MIGPVAVRTPPPPVPERPITASEGSDPLTASNREAIIPGKLSPHIESPGILTVSETSSGRQCRTVTQTWQLAPVQTILQIPVIRQRRQEPQLKKEARESKGIARMREKKTINETESFFTSI